MPKRNYFILAVFLLTAGCSKKEPMYTQEQMQHFVDSVMQVTAPELEQQAKRDLELRLPIELPPKIDSALQRPVSMPQLPAIDTFSLDAQPLPAYDTANAKGKN